MSKDIKYRPCSSNVEMQFLATMIREQEVVREQAERDLRTKVMRYGAESVIATNAASVHLQQYLIWEALLEKMSRWVADLAEMITAASVPSVPPKRRG